MKPLIGLTVNLASDPFRRERAQNTVYAVVCAVLFCTLLFFIGAILHARSQASVIRSEIALQTASLRRLQNEQMQYSEVLRRPGNADTFARSVFLNELIARRGVSWTKVFEDLSTVLPSNMRVDTIRLPQVPSHQSGDANRVQLDMTVGTDRPEAILDLLKNLESSALFGSPAVVSQTPPTQNDPLYKYRVTVAYAQKL